MSPSYCKLVTCHLDPNGVYAVRGENADICDNEMLSAVDGYRINVSLYTVFFRGIISADNLLWLLEV